MFISCVFRIAPDYGKTADKTENIGFIRRFHISPFQVSWFMAFCKVILLISEMTLDT